MFKLKVGHVVLDSDGKSAVLFLPDTKGSKRTNVFETIVVDSPDAVRLLQKFTAGRAPNELVLNISITHAS